MYLKFTLAIALLAVAIYSIAAFAANPSASPAVVIKWFKRALYQPQKPLLVMPL